MDTVTLTYFLLLYVSAFHNYLILYSNFQFICKLNHVLGKSSFGLALEVPLPVNADFCFAGVLGIAQPSKLTVKINHHLGTLEIKLSVISKTRLHEASFSSQSEADTVLVMKTHMRIWVDGHHINSLLCMHEDLRLKLKSHAKLGRNCSMHL